MRQEVIHDLYADRRLALHRRNQSGQDLVEFALVLPLLLVITFGIIDFSRVVFAYNTIANAAREGARYGVVNRNASSAAIISEAMELAAGPGCEASTPAATVSPAAPRTTTVTVSINCDVQLITGVLWQALGSSDIIPLTASATMRVE